MIKAAAATPSYGPSEAMMIVTPMNTSSNSPHAFYFGSLPGTTSSQSLPPYLDKPNPFSLVSFQQPTAHHHHISLNPTPFSPLSLNHGVLLNPQNHNDMMVDEAVPSSPSSSNSHDQNEEEESAAAILLALESGSLSPRGYLQTQHSASLQKRQRKVSTSSPTYTRRTKRISSLTEINGVPSGKEAGNICDDSDMQVVGSPPQANGYGSMGVTAGPSVTQRQHSSSWSSPSTMGFQFSPTSSSPLQSSGTSSPIAIPKNRHTTFGSYSPSLSTTAPSAGKKQRRAPRARLENHQCPNCHTSDSPLWRNCLIKGKILHLCNSCGLRYKKHKYCPHCYKVYYDAETNVHDWAQCITCHNWTHRQCLSDAGIEQSQPYRCLRCLGLLPDCE